MGSFAFLTASNYLIYDTKNDLDRELISMLFLDEDIKIEQRKNSNRNTSIWGDAYKKDKGTYKFIGYQQSSRACRERLEIFGFTKKKASKHFTNAKKEARKLWVDNDTLRTLTYDDYLKEIRSVIKEGATTNEFKSFTFYGDDEKFPLWLYGMTFIGYLYSILSILDDDDIIEYDLSDLEQGGWIDEKAILSNENEKIIVLTEGKTDTEFISKSIKNNFPHLRAYYHFLDFETEKIEANASALVKLVKAFASANMKNPIIAIFDNDTTGIKEMKKVDENKLPHHIKVLRYPDIGIAKKYPTIGPTGNRKMNVNGYACSIEMYFGSNTLTDKGELMPIKWTGYDNKENKYQGELSDKKLVQSKIKSLLSSGRKLEIEEINALLRTIFNAFN